MDGIHHLLNVVTNVEEIPTAVLIRAIKPVDGIDIMLERRGKKRVDSTLTSGPGSLTKALGIDMKFNYRSYSSNNLWIEEVV